MSSATYLASAAVESSLAAQLSQSLASNVDAVGSRAAARAFLAAIVDSSDDSIVGTDLTGRIISWNSGAHRLFGYTHDEALGNHVTLLFPSDQSSDLSEVLDAADRGEHVERYESVRLAKGGKPVEVSVILSPVKDEDGRLIGVSGIYRDLTRRRRLEKELVGLKEKAEEANNAKSTFLASMSHEVRTPMNGILGMTEILLETNLDDEQREYLSIIKYSADSLLMIVNDILDFSKIEANKLDIARMELHPRDLVSAVIREMNFAAARTGLVLVGHVHQGTPEVILGDPLRLRQILVNLIGNAIKFTDVGKIEVVLAPVVGAPALRFSVSDSGSGIPPEEQDLIFESFAQLGPSTAQQVSGTGLGLTISARLVALMGGEIWVESDGCSGSTFHFTLPVQLPD